MSTSCQPIDKAPHQQVPKSTSNTSCYLLTALNVIVLLGTLVASGYFYSQLGPISWSILGGGVLWVILSCFVKYGCSGSHSEQNKNTLEKVNERANRALVFQDTLKAIRDGYSCNGQHYT